MGYRCIREEDIKNYKKMRGVSEGISGLMVTDIQHTSSIVGEELSLRLIIPNEVDREDLRSVLYQMMRETVRIEIE